jgi:DNA-binding NtrC family response regulator
MTGARKFFAHDSERPCVLCVDDEPNLLAGLALLLRRRYRVVTAASGAGALELIARQPAPDVVISDMRMPVMTGSQFLAKAAAVAPHATRILLTGDAALDDAVAAVADGRIFRFLVKPCPAPLLLAAIDEAVEHRRQGASR